MDVQNKVNIVRALGVLSGVMERQRTEYLCGECLSFRKTSEVAIEALSQIDPSGLPEGAAKVFTDASATIKSLRLVDDPKPQRKLGSCTFPEKVCYVKYVRKFFVRTVEENTQL